LITKLENSVTNTIRKYDQTVEEQHALMLRQINQQFGPESTQNTKQRIEYQDSIKNQYIVSFIDPLKIQDKIKQLKEYIDNYLTIIDSRISNATETTYVEI